MSYNIKHISFLNNDNERQIIKSINKKFKLKYVEVVDGVLKQKMFWFKAKEFVEHPRIRDRDPVLNFDNGQKMRVYQSGDSSYMIIEAASKLELHDNQSKKKPTPKKIQQKSSKNKIEDENDLWASAFDDYII